MTSVFKLLPQRCCLVMPLKEHLEKNCTKPQVCLVRSLSHRHALIARTSLNSLSLPPPEHADLIISLLLCLVLHCCLSPDNAQPVEGECCWSLHSLAAAVLWGDFCVGIWQPGIPLLTPVKDQPAFLEQPYENSKAETLPEPQLFTQTV